MSSTRKPLSTPDLVALGAMGVVTAAAAPFAVVALFVGALIAFGQPLTVTGLVLHDAPMAAPPGVETAVYGTAAVTLSDAPAHLRWLTFIGGALPALATGTIGVAAAWLGVGVMRGRPFIRGASATVFAMATAIILGGVFGSITQGVSRAATIAHLEGLDASFAGTFLHFETDLEVPSLWLGLTLLLVGVIFQIGRKMQHDTEGLV